MQRSDGQEKGGADGHLGAAAGHAVGHAAESSTGAGTMKCGQAVARLLELYGVQYVFGIPGNHTLELYRGLEGSSLRHITVRHEQGAAFMADGYARVSGQPGVCYLISGPGLLNAATAIAQALADSIPMLVITAVASRDRLNRRLGDLHELPDQQAAATSFCALSLHVASPDQISEKIHEAFSFFATHRPGPVHVQIPMDVMAAEVDSPEIYDLPTRPPPNAAAVERMAALLRKAQQPALLLGGGALGAAGLVTELAETLDAPTLTSTNAKGLVPYGHPLAVGGSLSLPALRQSLLEESDLILAIGTELGETDSDFLLQGEIDFQGKVARIDIDPEQLERTQRPLATLEADAAAAIAALLPLLPARQSERGEREQSRGGEHGGGSREHGGADMSGGGQREQSGGAKRAATWRQRKYDSPHYHEQIEKFFTVLKETAPDAVVVGDSNRPVYYGLWQFECERPCSFFHSATGFGTLGYALPASLGASLGGDRPVIALIGDGGIQFTLPELATAADNGINVPIIIWRNKGYEEIEHSLAAMGIGSSFTRVSSPDFSAIAEAYGFYFAEPTDWQAFAQELETSLQADKPTLLVFDQDRFITKPSGGWYE